MEREPGSPPDEGRAGLALLRAAHDSGPAVKRGR